MKSFLFMLCSLFICFIAGANDADTSTLEWLKKVEMSGYMEFYMAYDDDENNKHERPDFLYHNTRTGELALNIGFVKAAWKNDQLRGNMALMTGTYPARNLATEPEMFQHVFEANIGLKMSKKRNWWLDMGILPSHIGLETALGRDNPTLTRSLIAENSPYYETGLRASYTSPDEKFFFAGLLLNGWQRIYKVDGDYLPATGIQFTWKPNKKWVFNYSNYAGDESPEEDYALRFFNDLYVTWQPHKKWNFLGAFDFGVQPDLSTDEWEQQTWYGWFGIARYNLTSKLGLALRLEQYIDNDEVIVKNQYDDGFSMNGYSINLDYKFNEHALLRLEGRRFDSEIFAFET
ncbi:MAG: outer membrane beta-barrel protein, partial [Flavobacteriales bacterium]